jgi:peptidoglycan/LPS O-acetylase OafA/YrhL
MALLDVVWCPERDLRTAAALRRRYRLLDTTRGLAAIAVLIWHYQHFYYEGTFNPINAMTRHQQPLYTLISPLYHYGYFGVRYFWMLSGFVFTITYLSRPVGGSEFVIRRFARLYPLHFVTFIIVAALQMILLHVNGRFSIYPYNDAYHFVLNIFMIPAWGFEAGYSFNAPIWSVSIELIVYAAFFFSLSMLRYSPYLTISGFLLLGSMLMNIAETKLVGECFLYFYAGCFIVVLLCRVFSLKRQHRLYLGGIGAIAGLSLTALLARHSALVSFEQRATVLSAILITGLGVFEATVPIRTRVFDWLGHSSYGIYLWHVPIQLVIILATSLAGTSLIAIASEPSFLIAFTVGTMAVALLGYLYFEAPAQNLILVRYLKRAAEAPA